MARDRVSERYRGDALADDLEERVFPAPFGDDGDAVAVQG